jgi:hypothetical protein
MKLNQAITHVNWQAGERVNKEVSRRVHSQVHKEVMRVVYQQTSVRVCIPIRQNLKG